MTEVAQAVPVAQGSRLFSRSARELTEYPDTRTRAGYLALTVLVTITLYYLAYCGGSVSTLQLADLHMSFHFLIWTTAIGNFVGAAGSFFAGITDRIGRVQTIIVGFTLASVLTLFALPNSPNRWVFALLALIVGNIEGIVLVATPALVRDFSPQTGRAQAMGFWTLGPVIGSLIVSVVGTWTIHGTPPAHFWGHEYVIAGVTGVVVSVIAAVFLKELAPGLRDQMIVTEADRVLVEARAKGIDVAAALRNPFRQMMKADVIISGFAVSVLLLAYYTAIALGVIIFQVIFGFSLHQANALGNWTWGTNAVTVVVVGVISDKLRVRKPFMVIGAVIAAVAIVLYLSRFGHQASFGTVAFLVSLISFGLGVAYTPWMASFTETVEEHNPALTATGLAVWGLTLRVIVFVMLILAPIVITSVTPIVNFVVRTSPFTATIEWAGTHTAFIAQVENPANLTQIGKLQSLQASNPAQMNAIQANATDLATLATYSVEVSAIAAHPTLFTQLAAKPTDTTLQAQAVAALGGGSVGQQRLLTIASHSNQIVPALTYAKAHPDVVAFALQNSATLTWATQHAALLAQVKQYAPELTQLKAIPPSVLAYANANAASAVKDEKAIAGQMQHWYWLCFAGPIIFLGCVPLLRGRWSPRRAKQDFDAHEALVQAELARLQVQGAAPLGTEA
ncbi:MAG TPA: MFS transporter [Acidimicrobiales bacterium]|nr:MFS transporter [Acidimicrobiales bacterium]